MKTKNSALRNPGRPREFDSEKVLDAAIQQFTLQGYHGSSISSLSQATSLTAGSLYKAYTDKRGLFNAALQRYVSVNNQRLEQQLASVDSGLAGIRLLLNHYLNRSSGESGRIGCLVVSTANELAATDPQIATVVAELMERYRQRFLRCLQQGIRDGSINASLDAERSASLLLAMTQGIRVLGKSGLSPQVAAQIEQSAIELLKP
ncbi:TetR/AcrR family transcriptional regulator [Tatumella saanichensis]|uniref:TetR/AcrR family transcriptional regulator n=1 Tax=Tatumella saanichensis TaxID=480813 RepID=UPI0004A2A711|nr:TetR/AcrR family transcriptional regulator [Tatumella saanichensis]